MYSTNYTSNYNQLKDIKDVNNVASVPISKDAERILSLKAKWCKQGISPDWIEAIYQQKVEPEDKTIDFDLERQKILAKLGQSETL